MFIAPGRAAGPRHEGQLPSSAAATFEAAPLAMINSACSLGPTKLLQPTSASAHSPTARSGRPGPAA